ncbi:MAG TPA: STAS domain-containing protein [Candidatus Polarisedimenticolaceae bacterium]
MRIDRRDEDGVAVVTVAEPGEIDLDRADAFRDTVLRAVGDAKRVVLDCTLVEFFDSAGMAALLSIQKEIVQRRRGAFALAGLHRSVLEVFRMVGFDVIFLFHPDAAAAVAAVRG